MRICTYVVLAIIAGAAIPAGLCQAQEAEPAPLRKIEPGPEVEAPPAEGQAPAPEPGAEPEKKPAPPGSPFDKPFLLVLILAVVFLFLWSSFSRRKQEAKRKQLLESLKKGDRVVTIGGIIGTIVEPRENEVVVKVDETNNVRMHFARWAIRGTGEEAKTEPPEGKK